jgi:hypothetical protein
VLVGRLVVHSPALLAYVLATQHALHGCVVFGPGRWGPLVAACLVEAWCLLLVLLEQFWGGLPQQINRLVELCMGCGVG